MGLTRKYDQRFERILWPEYPKWPVGRSNKEESEKAFLVAEKKCGGFSDQNIETLRSDIVDRRNHCDHWQKGSKYGPPSMRKYFNQLMWNEPIKKAKPLAPSHVPFPDVPRGTPNKELAQRAVLEAKAMLGRLH